jgi:hypothetical protein
VTGFDDVAVTTHDWFKDDPDGDYTVAEEDEVIAALDNFFGAISAFWANNVTLDFYKLYRGYNGDGSPGEVDRTVDRNIGGAGIGSMLPPQCAMSVTELVVRRPSWGRFYIPGFAVSVVNDEGSWNTVVVDAVADAAEALYEATDFPNRRPVVWGKTEGAPGVTPYEVQQIRVDDLVDIIRSRRWRSPTLRDTRTIT